MKRKQRNLLDRTAVQFSVVRREEILNYLQPSGSFEDIETAKQLYSKYLLKNPEDEEIKSSIINQDISDHITIQEQGGEAVDIPIVHVRNVHKALGFRDPVDYPASSFLKPLTDFKMEMDDSPILKYIYRNFKPRRHLEFGTWQGTGATYCLEECEATVWTINPPFGETKETGEIAYGTFPEELDSARAWAEKIGLPKQGSYRTDSLGFIGRYYLEKGLGKRVCQIYCDSRDWDITNYPGEFFDSVLIDGGHTREIVVSDTLKGLELLRSGGMILWHDLNPVVFREFDVTLGVMQAIQQEYKTITSQTNHLFWIYPSWILLGIKK
jgi:hypothetical protein